MGKYGSVMRSMKLSVGGFDKELKPRVGDVKEFIGLSMENEDRTKMLENFSEYVKKLIGRDYPPNTDEEREELNLFVEQNLVQLLKRLQIIYGFATEKDFVIAQKLEDEKSERTEGLRGSDRLRRVQGQSMNG